MTGTGMQSLVVDINYLQAGSRPLDLRKFMVVGGAESKPNVSYSDLCAQRPERLQPKRHLLLATFKEELETSKARGDSPTTCKNKVYAIRGFYVWGDQHDCTFTMETARQDCIAYLRNLHERAYIRGSLDKSSAHAIAQTLASMLKGIARTPTLLRAAGFPGQPTGKRLGSQADKQNLANTFRFIDFLRHFAEHLTLEALTGALPLRIPLPDGNSISLAGAAPRPRIAQGSTDGTEKWHPRYPPVDPRTAVRTRGSLLNMATEINLLYFIANTGMNLGQALSLRMESARYQSEVDDHKVLRVYKNRRGGNAEFEIPRAYRGQFEGLLKLRQSLFANVDNAPELFLFVQRGHDHKAGRSKPTGPNFTLTRNLCKLLDIPFVSAQRLRRTRVNWLLRRSQDPDLTAEMAQHTREILLDTYAEPSHQLTAVEISRFHLATEAALASAIPGRCDKASPTARQNTPDYAPKPDCASPAGCLFCTHYYGLDTADYMWSLATYRHLKSLELCRTVPSARNQTTQSPAHAVVERLTEILDYLQDSSDKRAGWVAEGKAKVAEGDYHLDWAGFIHVLEAYT